MRINTKYWFQPDDQEVKKSIIKIAMNAEGFLIMGQLIWLPPCKDLTKHTWNIEDFNPFLLAIKLTLKLSYIGSIF